MIAASVSSSSGLFVPESPAGWAFAPEGAAIHLASGAAIVADVHLGYEWSRASGGDMIPEHSLAETLAKLDRLLARASVSLLIVAGDLVESARPCPRTARDVSRMIAWLRSRVVEFLWLRGNHDPPRRPALPASTDLDGWTILHGDRPPGPGRAIFGHHHPALYAEGLRAPCFLIGATTIALPAFSPNAAGLDILASMPSPLDREPLRCVAGLGDELLDFGPRDALARRLGRDS